MCQVRLHHNQRVECPHPDCSRVIVRKSLESHLVHVHHEKQKDAKRLADDALPPDRVRRRQLAVA
jgi:hypothetical protein